jgi:hypothetical protein
MSNWHYKIIIFLGLLAVAWQPALACDPCSLYCSAKVKDIKAGTWTASISNQYSSFKKPKGYLENSQQNGESVTGFSTAQLALGYDLTDRFALQIAVPVIARSYEKFSNYRKSTATDYGLGDITIAASYMPWRLQKDSLTVSWSVFSGLELPTGKTGAVSKVIFFYWAVNFAKISS